MVLFNLLVISLFCAISATDPQIERQNTVDNYESLNRYKPTDSSSYSSSGGYYPRNVYEQLNHNRYNSDLSGREFRPPNVFAAGLLSTPTPYMSPLIAQQRQYQVSMSGPSGLMPYQMGGSPLMQSSGYSMGGTLGSQYSGLNSGAFGFGGPRSLGIGDSAASIGQGYGYGNLMSDPYYGIGNRQSYGMSSVNPYSMYSSQGLYSSPYLTQTPNYQSLSYANPTSGYLNRGYSAYGFAPQYAGQSYQTLPTSGQSNSYGSQLGQNSGYSNYNNYNSNTGLGSVQSGLNEGIRDDKNYASSASTQTESHSGGAQSSNETPVFHSIRIIKNNNIKRSARNGRFADHKMTE